MGHFGLTPQSATMLGGFKAQGARRQGGSVYEDALALEAAGCFAIVLEAVPAAVAARITEALAVPTIGIGAGPRPTARCSSGTTCSASTRGSAPLRQAVRRPRRGDRRPSAPSSRRYATAASLEEQHTYSMPAEELALFEDASPNPYEPLDARTGGAVASRR